MAKGTLSSFIERADLMMTSMNCVSVEKNRTLVTQWLHLGALVQYE